MEAREVPNPYSPHELKEICRGARILLQIKCSKIDPDIAAELEKLKIKIQSRKAKITEDEDKDRLEVLSRKKYKKIDTSINYEENPVRNNCRFSKSYRNQNRKLETPGLSKAEYEHSHEGCSNSHQDQDRNKGAFQFYKTEHEYVLEKMKHKGKKIVSFSNDNQTPPRKASQFLDHDQNHLFLYQTVSFPNDTQNPSRRASQFLDHDQIHPFPVHPFARRKPWLIGKYSQAVNKTLTRSDVDVDLQRLQLSKKHSQIVFAEVMSPQEKNKLLEGIPVKVYGNDGEKEYNMEYKCWKTSPVLAKGWKKFFDGEKMKAGDHVTLWLFRNSVTNKLGLLCSSRKP